MTETLADTPSEMAAPAAETSQHRALAAGRTMTARDDDDDDDDDQAPHERDQSERALRVSQLDSDEMDTGLIHMLNAKISRALSVFGPSYESRYAPEIALVLKLLLYRMGVWNVSERATPGLKLQNLRYAYGRDRSLPIPRSSLYLLPLLTTIPSYLVSRLHMNALSASFPEYPRGSLQRRWWLLLERFLAIGKFVELSGFLAFLWDGKYPNIMARILKMRLVPEEAMSQVTRVISYEYMNRQLVWTGFTEFLIFLLPILQARQTVLTAPLKRAVRVLQRGIQFFKTPQVARDYEAVIHDSKQNGSGRGHPAKSKARQEKHGRLWRLPKETCAICHLRLRPTIDHQLGLPALEAPIPEEEGQVSAAAATSADPHAVSLLMHDTSKLNELDGSETEIHIPTRTDCEAGCTYCYYCIAQELSALAKQAQQSATTGKDQKGQVKAAPGWDCLRCGSKVFSCHRVVEDSADMPPNTTD
ncbi:hypothetical protein NliqN6_6019 [Naganishia liquefaciens]|uniref:RING-type E3 ubiquitin transferase (cysteine targeting) n=1 Tax=Naganishia liquefaciens TaxID=104408 RepID=A0A8H3TYU6_9TREE|nr:hypothetical protein NliqN6_6019 [Naganishia liquefaciens]